MKTLLIKRPTDERGIVMLIVLLIMAAVSIIGLGAMTLVVGDLRIAGNYRDSSAAFWAAEGALQNSLWTLRENQTFTGAVAGPTMTNGASSSATVATFAAGLVKVVATGKKGSSTKVLEGYYTTGGLYGAGMTVGGTIVMQGTEQIGSAGVRLNGNGTFQLNSGSSPFTLYVNPSSSVTVQAPAGTVTQMPTPPLNMAAYKLTADEWAALAAKAPPAWNFSSGATIQGGLNFNNVTPASDGTRTVYVNGNAVIQGNITGVGTIAATGTLVTQGATSTGATVSFVSKGDMTLQFGGSANLINALMYTEGNLVMQGAVNITGACAVFGNATMQGSSQFIGNNDPNFWNTYSGAYQMLSQPVALVAWAQDQ